MPQPAQSMRLELTVLRCPRRQVDAVFLHPAVFACLPPLPVLRGELEWSTKSAVRWVLPDTEDRFSADVMWSQTAFVTQRTLDALGCSEGDVVVLTVEAQTCRVGPALVNSPLGADEIECHENLFPGEDLFLLTSAKAVAIAGVRRTSSNSLHVDRVRLSAHTRHLLGLSSQLSSDLADPSASSIVTVTPWRGPIETSGFSSRATSSSMSAIRQKRRQVHVALRRSVLAADAFGGRIVGAPEASLLATRADLGDDTHRIVRIDEEFMRIIGAEPGSGIYVRWGSNEVMAVLHPARRTNARYEFGQPIGGGALRVDDEFRVSLPLEIRMELGLPAGAIVQVRRRVFSVIATQVNSAIVPLAGFTVAALALPQFSVLSSIVGMVIVTTLALVPVRVPRAPKGLWR
jgi:hypothetical protein